MHLGHSNIEAFHTCRRPTILSEMAQWKLKKKSEWCLVTSGTWLRRSFWQNRKLRSSHLFSSWQQWSNQNFSKSISLQMKISVTQQLFDDNTLRCDKSCSLKYIWSLSNHYAAPLYRSVLTQIKIQLSFISLWYFLFS